jgi:hypothetical protein
VRVRVKIAASFRDGRDELRDYARNVIDKSWPLQRQGIVPTEESHLVTKFIDDLVSFEPSKRSEEILHVETLHQLNSQVELRRSRLANVTAGIPGVLWWVVAFGAVISVILLAMLDMEIPYGQSIHRGRFGL